MMAFIAVLARAVVVTLVLALTAALPLRPRQPPAVAAPSPPFVVAPRATWPICPGPRVTRLTVRRATGGHRLTFSVGAEAGYGHVNALVTTWGDGLVAVHKLVPRARVSVTVAHRYPHAGRHVVSIVAESTSRPCGVLTSRPVERVVWRDRP